MCGGSLAITGVFKCQTHGNQLITRLVSFQNRVVFYFLKMLISMGLSYSNAALH